MTIDVVPESEILRPRDPSLIDDNDWPDFLLTNVKITDSESGEPISLLHASARHPVDLVGKLPKFSDRGQYKTLINSKLAAGLPTNIEVFGVQHFCYGQNDEGEAIMWAAGKAGWFQIQPSRTYKAIHKQSCEAINTLYFVSDFCRELQGRKVKSTPIDVVFREYTAEPSHDCSDEEHAEAIFLRHGDFLYNCMLRGKEGINWKNTSIFEWLSRVIAETSAESGENSIVQTPQGADNSETDEPVTRRAGKGKSSLRPRSIKHSLKGIGRRYSIADVEMTDSSVQATTAPLKRKRRSGRTSKPRKRGNAIDQKQDDISTSSYESDFSSPPDEPSLPLSVVPKRSGAVPKNAPFLQIIEEELPSFEPQGPDEIWICTFDGCSHVVYDAKKIDNRELIKEHYRWHAFEKQSQLDLVYKEERPYLPVNNLIKRIREMASQHQSAEPQASSGVDNTYPTPIKRLY